jgi:nicotinamidase-related amidase
MKEALLVIDMQKKFYKGRSKLLMDEITKNVNDEIHNFRKSNQPIIWIYHARKYGKLKKGNQEYEFIDTIEKAQNELCVEKTYSNGFRATNLKAVLDNLEIDNLKLCGYKAEACILFTFLGAKKLKYKISILKNGTASSSKLGIKIGELFYKNYLI